LYPFPGPPQTLSLEKWVWVFVEILTAEVMGSFGAKKLQKCNFFHDPKDLLNSYRFHHNPQHIFSFDKWQLAQIYCEGCLMLLITLTSLFYAKSEFVVC
jgi:hypothetical protein